MRIAVGQLICLVFIAFWVASIGDFNIKYKQFVHSWLQGIVVATTDQMHNSVGVWTNLTGLTFGGTVHSLQHSA